MHKELKYNTNKRKCKIYNDLQANILFFIYGFGEIPKHLSCHKYLLILQGSAFYLI